MFLTHHRRSAPLLLAVALSVFASACGKPGDGARQNDDHRKQQADQAMDDEMQARIAKHRAAFAEARRNPALVQGKLQDTANVNCDGSWARSASGETYVRIERPMPDRVGYLHVEAQGNGSAYISAEFLESVDRQERIFLLTALTQAFPKVPLLRLSQDVLREVADLVQTYHARCIATETKVVRSFLLVDPK